MPRHIEQPAARHRAPASRKIWSSPSSLCRRRTRTDPARRASAPVGYPRARGSRRGRAQVLDPPVGARADEDVSTDVAHLVAGLGHVLQRLSARRRAGRSKPDRQRRTEGAPWSGLVPQVPTAPGRARPGRPRRRRGAAVAARAQSTGVLPLAPPAASPSRYSKVVSSGAIMPARARPRSTCCRSSSGLPSRALDGLSACTR